MQYPVVNIAGGPEGPEPYFSLEIVNIFHIRRYGT